MGLLYSRSRSQQRFRMLKNVCPDSIICATEHFVTKPGMIMQHHKPECDAEKLVHCVWCQGHSEGLCNQNIYKQNMTISVVSFKVLASLQPDLAPPWGAADTEVKIPSVDNTELKGSPFEAWSRSAYSHTCYGYCQGFLPCLILPFQSTHLRFFLNLSRFLLCWLRLTHGSCVGPQNKIGRPARGRLPCWVPAE